MYNSKTYAQKPTKSERKKIKQDRKLRKSKFNRFIEE